MIPEAGLLPGEAGFSSLFDAGIEGTCRAIDSFTNRPAVKVLLDNCASGDPAAIRSALPDAVNLCTIHRESLYIEDHPDAAEILQGSYAAEKLMRYSALMLAVQSGRSGAVRVLLDEKTSPDFKGARQ